MSASPRASAPPLPIPHRGASPPAAGAREQAGRMLLAAALTTFVYSLLGPHLADSGKNLRPELWVAPRICLFALAALCAELLLAAHPRQALLLVLGLFLGLLSWPLTSGWELQQSAPPVEGALSFGSLLGLQCSLFSALLLGGWLARFSQAPGHLLVVALCAAAGDAWFGVMQIPESVSGVHPLRATRLSWPPTMGNLITAPSFPELLYLAFFLESARRFRFRTSAVVIGILGGYLIASFLSLATLRVMLTLPLVGLGALLGAWPDFRCTGREVGVALGAAGLLFLLLLGLTALHGRLHPAPERPPEIYPSRDVAALRAPRAAWADRVGAAGSRPKTDERTIGPGTEKNGAVPALGRPHPRSDCALLDGQLLSGRTVRVLLGSGGHHRELRAPPQPRPPAAEPQFGIRTWVPTEILSGFGKLLAATSFLGGTLNFRATA